jgi:ADP-ribosylation factor GTPase-activating protein 2/3
MFSLDLLTPLTCRYPEEVIVTDIALPNLDGSSTPAGQPDDDFFSSWDKPSIKRPSNPPSRTGTPSAGSRTGSPFLNPGANGNGASRPKSPLSSTEKNSASPPPAAVRPGSVVRKAPTTTGAKKGNVLGSKKTQKLGAKKVVSGDIDFEAAEKKAKEEAERIEKLGYDPEAEEAEVDAKAKSATAATKIASPTPISPARGGFGSTTKGHERSPSELERLGMGMNRLGFGQMNKPAAPKKLGFGAVGPKAPADGMHFVFCYFPYLTLRR